MSIWIIIADIASVCSIIAFLITLWQLHQMRSKIKSTEAHVQELFDWESSSTAQTVLEKLHQQQTELSNLVIMTSDSPSAKGTTAMTIKEKLYTVQIVLDNCCFDLPSDFTDEINCLKRISKKLNQYADSQKRSDLIDTKMALIEVIGLLKKRVSNEKRAELSRIET